MTSPMVNCSISMFAFSSTLTITVPRISFFFDQYLREVRKQTDMAAEGEVGEIMFYSHQQHMHT